MSSDNQNHSYSYSATLCPGPAKTATPSPRVWQGRLSTAEASAVPPSRLQRQAAPPGRQRVIRTWKPLAEHKARLAALVLGLGCSLVAPLAQAAPFSLEQATIPSINAAFDAGVLTSAQLVQLYLNRIAAYDGPGGLNLNTIISLNPNAVAQAAALDLERGTTGPRSALHGIPVLLKDNIDTSFLPTTAGFLGLAGSLPPDNATIAQKLLDAGAIILGKTSLTEFANYLTSGMPAGYSSLNGYTFNPYNPVALPGGDGRPLLSPGGSSAGSGAAMAANFATIAIGTETSGSILSPANQNSLVGIKPTVGLWSRDGIIPIAASQDTAGPMARSVTDAAILLGALTGEDPKDPQTSESVGKAKSDYTPYLRLDALQGARLGYYAEPNGSTASGAEQLAIFNQALDVLRAEGATVLKIPFTPPTNSSTVLPYEFKRDLNAYLASLGPAANIQDIDDVNTFIIDYNAANPDPAGPFKYGKVRIDTSRLIDLTPGSADTIRYQADRAADILNSRTLGIDAFMAANTLDAILFSGASGAAIGARAGYPTIIVPAGYQTLNNKNPLGLSFLAKAYEEEKLLGYAYDFEQASLARLSPLSTPPLAGEPVPGPLAVSGAAMAWTSSRKLRRRCLVSRRKACQDTRG
ncbi:MAG: amidase family protein [Cyanobacteriota bacterium]|nr:amidase family protein [Cyanobacteriota bacterium]